LPEAKEFNTGIQEENEVNEKPPQMIGHSLMKGKVVEDINPEINVIQQIYRVIL